MTCREIDRLRVQASDDWMIAVSDDFVVVADARIDHRDATSWVSPSETPAQLILDAWRAQGPNAVLQLYGDYAFVVLDRAGCRLFCVRDHIGSVPLWYAWTEDETLIVGTQYTSVSRHPGVSDTLSLPALALYIQGGGRWGQSPSPLEAVKLVPSGAWLSVSGEAEETRRWWDPATIQENAALTDGQILDTLQRLLQLAVEHRIDGAAHVAVHLSGGLDSGSIALIAQNKLQDTGRKIKLGFAWQAQHKGGTPSPEHLRIAAIAKATGIEPAYAAATPQDIKASLALDPSDGPPPEMHWLETPILRRCKMEGVELILSGWGGDECVSFNGRDYFPTLLKQLRLRKLARHQGTGDLTRLQFFMRYALKPVLRDLKDKLLFRPSQVSVRQRARRKTSLVSDRLKAHLPAWQSEKRISPAADLRAPLLSLGHLQHRMESWADHGAQYGIRYRYPLLDRRLLEFALSIPADRVFKGRVRRWPLREVLKRLGAPDEIVSASKLETERVSQSLEVLHAALREIGKAVQAMDPPPSGADFVDFAAMNQALRKIEAEDADSAKQAEAYNVLRLYQRAFQVVGWARADSQSSAEDR